MVRNIKLFTKKECSEIIEMINKGKMTLKNEYGGPYVYSCEILNELSDKPVFNAASKKTILDNIKEKLKNKDCFNGLKIDKDVELKLVSVNKYSKETLVDMELHHDMVSYSMVVFLNNDYDGGGLYFPFYNKFFNKNKISVGDTLLWESDKPFAFHEVVPIKSGERYCLIMFLQKKNINNMVFNKIPLKNYVSIILLWILFIKITPVYKILKWFKLRNIR